MKFFSPQSTAGVPQEIRIAVISQTIVANGDQVSNMKEIHTSTECLHAALLK